MVFKCLVGGLALFISVLSGSWSVAAETTIFRIGTGGVGGTYYPVGQTISKAISNPTSATDCAPDPCGIPGLLAISQASNGSVSNIEDIENNKIESGFSQSDVAYWALNGSEVFKEKGEYKNIAVIASLYMENIHLVARKGSGIKSVSDLVGKRVSLDDPGSGTLVDARIILKAYGISEDEMRVQYIKPSPAVKKIRAGALDAFFIVAGHPSKAIVELSNDDLVTVINIDGPAADKIVSEYSYFSKQVIPAGNYKGVGDVHTLGVAALWIVGKDQSDETVYKITKAFWENLPGFQKSGAHPKLSSISLKTAFESVSVPFHPGAMKYYDEIGLKDPHFTTNRD